MNAGWRVRVIAVAAAVAAGTTMNGVAQAEVVEPAGVQIDVGGEGGNGFLPDSYFSGGGTDINRTGSNGLPNWIGAVANPIPQEQWNTFRVGDASYRIPGLTPGASYDVRLYFDDWYWTKTGQRVFDVAVNGTVVLDDFDIIRTAVDAGGDGRYLGVEKDFTVSADDEGTIAVDMIRDRVDQPLINAIVVVPTAGR